MLIFIWLCPFLLVFCLLASKSYFYHQNDNSHFPIADGPFFKSRLLDHVFDWSRTPILSHLSSKKCLPKPDTRVRAVSVPFTSPIFSLSVTLFVNKLTQQHCLFCRVCYISFSFVWINTFLLSLNKYSFSSNCARDLTPPGFFEE